MHKASAVAPTSFTLLAVDVEIRPEPDEPARRAILLALERAGVGQARPPAYDSPWRAAALDDAEPDAPDP